MLEIIKISAKSKKVDSANNVHKNNEIKKIIM